MIKMIKTYNWKVELGYATRLSKNKEVGHEKKEHFFV